VIRRGRQEYHADERQDSAKDAHHQRELAQTEAEQPIRAADWALVRMNEKGCTHSHLRVRWCAFRTSGRKGYLTGGQTQTRDGIETSAYGANGIPRTITRTIRTATNITAASSHCKPRRSREFCKCRLVTNAATAANSQNSASPNRTAAAALG